MRKGLAILLGVVTVGATAAAVLAQADHQVDDKGWIDIGSTNETATKKRPSDSFYKGSGIITYEGRPPKPYLQHDMGGYEVDPAPAADRNKPYNHHDLSHTWEYIISSGSSPLGSRVPPMTEAGYKMRDSHITDTDVYRLHKPSNDPELICDPLGYPRITFRTTRPFEVFQLPNVTLFHYVWHETWQKIWTDGRLLPKPPIDPAWIGYSVGKWVGNTFVVDTNGVDERAWLDTSGLGHSFDAYFQARWRRIDHNTLQYNLTIKDPQIYKETWNTPDTLFELYPNLELDILPCVPSEEEEYRENTPTELPTAGESTISSTKPTSK